MTIVWQFACNPFNFPFKATNTYITFTTACVQWGLQHYLLACKTSGAWRPRYTLLKDYSILKILIYLIHEHDKRNNSKCSEIWPTCMYIIFACGYMSHRNFPVRTLPVNSIFVSHPFAQASHMCMTRSQWMPAVYETCNLFLKQYFQVNSLYGFA